jgi:dipeptidyl-peptidase 4
MKKHLLIILLLTCISALSQSSIDNQVIWYSGTFYPEQINAVNSLNDGKHFTSLDNNRKTGETEINKYSYLDYTKTATLLSSSIINNLSIGDYQFNFDESKVLISTETEPIYRHSSKSNFYVYDFKTSILKELTDFSKGKQRLAEFSPKGDKIAFVRENNIFIIDLNTNLETQVTLDGKINEVINGATDWVYEEEFSFNKGFQWSSDGSKIAYYSFYEGDVKEFQMQMYGNLYPTQYKFKYPKAGENNSVVSIFVYELDQQRTTPFDIGTDSDIYIPRIKWSKDPNVLTVQKMNRLQNNIELLVGNFSSDRPNSHGVKTKTIYKESSKTYIDIHDNLIFLEGASKFLWTSEKDGYNHIYLIEGKTQTQITTGKWEVTEVYGYNNLDNSIYFQAAKEHPTKREVYSIKIGSNDLRKLSLKSGTNSAEFSKTYDYYIHYNTTANTPHYITLHDNSGKLIKVLKDNQALIKRMEKFNLSKKEFFTIKNDEGQDLNAWMIKPTNFKKNKKHPLLMFVYGGPGINTVNDSWEWMNYFWWQMLAQKGYIVVSVDARGTGFRGKDFKHSTYLQLGKLETEDQISVAKNLGNFKYIDKDRIGIFGWSYGGYMSSLCITKGADVFKTAIAVAPVTNWRYYDNIYTERFMRTPQENGKNYDINSPINHVDKLKGNYLLIHGMADDNVHYQNAVEMVDALIKANKQFDSFAYPNKNHGIYGGNTRWHLYDMMTNYLLENL